MKVVYLLISSFVAASGTVGAAIACVNQAAPDVQPTPIASVSPTPSPSPNASRTPTPTPQPELLSSRSPITLNGIGSVRVGMTLAQAEQASGVPIQAGDDRDNGCAFAQPQGIENLLFMVKEGRIVRVDVVGNSTIKTPNGAGIGNTEAEIEALYPGQVAVSPHEYIPGAHYLTVVPLDAADRDYRFVFETDANGVVTRFRSGQFPEVTWVEGCS